MNQRSKKVWILMLVLSLGCAGLFPATIASAADLPFDQGAGYELGDYDRDAAQPTAFNWTRQSRFTGSLEHDEKWSFEAEDSIYSSPAIGADGTLYVGSYDGKLYALNSKTGKLKWSFDTGGAIASSPAIGTDGTIYIGSGNGKLYALDPNTADDEQREKWSYTTGDGIYSSPVIGKDGIIFISSYDGYLYALDSNAADDEREIWSYELGGQLDSSPAIGADGTLYVGSGEGIFYALNPYTDDDAERLKWMIEPTEEDECWWLLDGPCSFYSSPAIDADGIIYVGSDDGYVYALDPNANTEEERLKWSYETWGSVLSSPAIGTDGMVYVGSYDGVLYALDPDATNDAERVKWSFDTSIKSWNIIISSPTIGADGTIYIGSIGWYGDGVLYALDPSAEDEEAVKWSFETEKEILSSAVIGPDGTIYIGAFDHKFYALGVRSIAAPQTIAAIAEENAVKLTWEAIDDAVGYNVYCYEGLEAPVQLDEWVLLAAEELIIETEYTAESLTAGKLYWFAVTAVGAGGLESDFSEPASATPYINLMEVDSYIPIQVAKGTKLEELSFPEEAHIRLTDGSELDLLVVWDLLNTDYNSEQAGSYTFTGELQLAEHIYNPHNLKVEQTVSVLPSTNAMLADIQLNGETLQGFKSEIYTYTVRYLYEIDEVVVVTAVYEQDAAHEIVGDNPQQLQVGSNLIEIVVTAENGDVQQYTIHVIREQDAEAPVWQSDSELKVSDITETSVKLLWPSAADNVDVIGYRLYVNDEKQVDEPSSHYEYLNEDGVYTYSMSDLSPNTNYRFTVTSYDAAGNESSPGLSQTAMTLPSSSSGGDGGNHSGGSGQYLSGNASLKTLEIWTDDGKLLSLMPSFTADTLAYKAKTEAKKVELKLVADHAEAKVIWKEQVQDKNIQLELQEGENVISLIVQAEDGSQKTYTFVIERIVPDFEEPELELPVISFSDITGHWAEDYIINAAMKGIVSGYPDGTFKPNKAVTRAEFIVMLMAALQMEMNSVSTTFTDNDQIGAWAKQAVAEAMNAGIITGYEDGSFRPNAQITRAEMAVMIARALQLSPSSQIAASFIDANSIPHWASGAVDAIYKLGIVEGRGGKRFVPNGVAIRAEATAMLLRMLERR